MKQVSKHDRLQKLLYKHLLSSEETCPDPVVFVVDNDSIGEYREFNLMETAITFLRMVGGIIRAENSNTGDILFEAEVQVTPETVK